MSALDYLLASYVKAETVREFALGRGISVDSVAADHSGEHSNVAWASALTQRLPASEIASFALSNLQWGRGATFDFPINEEVGIDGLRERLQGTVEARGDIFGGQAVAGASPDFQVAFIHAVTESLWVIVVDRYEPRLLERVEAGVASHMIPHWTMCALSTRPSSWRLEVRAPHGVARPVADALVSKLGFSYALPEPMNVRLSKQQFNALADELGAVLLERGVTTFQDMTGLRKIRMEKSPAMADLREAGLYRDILPGVDEIDDDTLEIPFNDESFRLYISRHGSFWFRRFTPRGLIDDVLGCAEIVLRV